MRHEYLRSDPRFTAWQSGVRDDPAESESGEQVRWLLRRRASGLALPGNDFWVYGE